MNKKAVITISFYLLLSLATNAQSFEKCIGINGIYIGQNANEIKSIGLSADNFKRTKKEFFPIRITNLATEAKSEFADSVFFNVDSLKRVCAVIFKTTRVFSLEAILVEKHGKPYSEINFIHSSKTWKVNDETISLHDLDGFTTFVILYKNNETCSLIETFPVN